MGKPDPYAELYAKMARNIERTGRSVMSVLSSPPFTYSIGNSLRHLPEIIVLGLAPEDAQAFVNHWSETMIERGREFADGELVDIGGKHPCKAAHCLPEVRDRYTIQAGRYLGHEDYRVTQLIVPDPSGLFPDDPRCESPYSRVPLLGLPRTRN